MSRPSGATSAAVDDEDGAQPVAGSGDGLPGVAVTGYPNLRAGAFGVGNGALGLYQVADRRGAIDASALPDYITKSGRWNDPNALAYELDRKQRQLGDAQALSLWATGAGAAQQGIADLAKVAPGAEALNFASPLAWAGIGTGAYMGFVEAPRLQNQVDALRSRLGQLRSGSRT